MPVVAPWMRTLALAGIVAAALSGCGGSSERKRPTGKVSGTVEMGGQPLAAGIVLFEDPTRSIGATAAVKEGKFSFTDPVPTGEYKVAVQPPPAPPPMQAGPAEPKVEIPAKYQTSKTSGLVAIVKEGTNDPVSLQLDTK